MLMAQDPVFTHHIRAGFGPSIPAGGYQTGDFSVSPALDFNYGLRVFRHVQLDGGVALDFQKYQDCSRFGCQDERRQLTFIPAGLRGVLPLHEGRFELSAGVGGAYLHDPLPYSYLSGGLFQIYGGASGALDRERRYHLDLLARYMRDLGRPTQQYVMLTVGFTWCPNCR